MAETFSVGTYNLGRAADIHPERIINDLTQLMKLAHVVVIQEAGGGEAKRLLSKICRELNLSLFEGFGTMGQSSTPILYRRYLKVYKRKSNKLTPSTKVSPRGAGGTTLKSKWLNAIQVEFNGKRIWVGNVHTTPSIYINERERLATKQYSRAVQWMLLRRSPKIIAGDFNSEPDHPIRKVLTRAGYFSAQGRRPLNTKDNRSIDDVYYKDHKHRMVLLSREVFKGASDHEAFIAHFSVS